MSEIHQVHTACYDCRFATWNGKTQDGCMLGRLDEFNKQSVEIVPAYNEEDQKFFVISGRLCTAKRTATWNPEKTGDENISIVDAVYNELKPKVSYIVYVDDPKLEGIVDTLDSITKQKIHPSLIMLVNNTDADPNVVNAALESLSSPIRTQQWIMKHVMEDDADMGRCIDISIRECKTRYFVVCKCGYVLDDDFSEILDHTININLTPVMFADLGDGAYVSQVFYYKYMGGNTDTPYVEKIQQLLKDKPEYIVSL